jgi:hypothetical protein
MILKAWLKSSIWLLIKQPSKSLPDKEMNEIEEIVQTIVKNQLKLKEKM